MIILADPNEQATNPKVIERLKKTFPKIQLQALEFGDVNVILENGEIISFERKRAEDFLGSIGNGRIFRQVEKMSQASKWCCIIVEGVFSYNAEDMVEIDGKATNWKGVSVRAAMMAIQWSGCPIIFTYKEDYPNTIAEIINFCRKPVEHYQSLGRNRIVTFPPITVTEDILSSFPGIGLKKARSLLNFIKDAGKKDEVSLGEALCWITMLSKFNVKSRPEGWGDKILSTVLITLGIKNGQSLDIVQDVEISKGKEKKK